MNEEVRLWWERSNADINTAVHSNNAGDWYAGGFWAQQSVEKALKALIIHKGEEFRKIHDLEALARRLDASESIIDKCRKISPAYTIARYPDAASKTSVKESESLELVKLAMEVLLWVEKQLK